MGNKHQADERAVFAPDVVLQTIGGEAILLKLADETVFSLNETGAHVAVGIARGSSIDAIIRELATAYGTEVGQIEHDVRTLLVSLVDQGLVVLERADASE